jgi:hypothetical protein
MIIVRTNYDLDTDVLYRWAEQFLEHAPAGCRDLAGANATAANLRVELSREDCPDLVAFYGHGDTDRLMEQGGMLALISVSVGVVPAQLKGKKLYAAASLTGNDLPKQLRAVGCEVIAYWKELIFLPSAYEERAGKIVNRGLEAWNTGASRDSVERQLASDWNNLANSIMSLESGSKRKLDYQAMLAAQRAYLNGDSIRSN